MADLAKLIISLEAQTSRFQSDLDKANGKLDRFERKATSSVNAVRNAFKNALGGIVAGIGVGGVFRILDAAIDNADKLGDMVEQTGIASDQLQALGNIAKQSGSDLDSVASAVAKFNKNISEGAGSNTEKLNDQALAFQALGVSIDDLKSKNTAQLLDQVAKKLSTFRDDANKTAIEMALFGKSGAELTPTLNALGKEGLDPATKRLRDMNALIGEDAIASAQQFNAKIDTLKGVVAKFSTTLAVGLLPPLEAAIGDFGDGKTEADKFKTAADGLANAFKAILVVTITLKTAVSILVRSLGTAAGVAADLFDGVKLGDLANPATALLAFGKSAIHNAGRIKAGVSAELEDSATSWSKSMDKIANVIAAGGEKINKALEKSEDNSQKGSAPNIEVRKQEQLARDEAARKRVAAMKKEAADREREQQQALESIRSLSQGLEQQVATFDKTDTEILKYRVTIGDLVDEIEKGGPAAAQFAQEAIKFQQALDDKNRAKQLAEDLKQVNIQLKELSGDTVGAALDSFDASQAESIKGLTESGNKAGLERIAVLRSAVEAQEQFNLLMSQADVIQQDLAVTEERIRNTREAGAITEFGMLTQLDTEREKSILQLETIRQKLIAIAEATGNPALLQATKQFGAQVDQLGTQTDLLEKKFRGVFQEGFEDAVTSVLDGTKSIGDAFRDMVRDIASQLAKMASQQIAQGIFSSLFGGAGGGAFAGSSIASGGIFSGFRASGGPVSAGQGYMVGERGPEYFVPNTSGRIMPNGQSQQMAQPKINIINVTDASQINQWATTPSGEKAIINILRRNAGAVRSVVA